MVANLIPRSPSINTEGLLESLCPLVHLSVLSIFLILFAQYLLHRSTMFNQTWYGGVLP